MAKPKKIREANNPIGRKINLVMAEKNMAGDYALLAKMFDVTTMAVYGWIDTGRIKKDRLPKLEEWSDHPLSWWLDASDTAPPPASDNLLLTNLQDWRLQASPKSQEVIDQLTLLAKKNKLRDEDWLLIQQMTRRFVSR